LYDGIIPSLTDACCLYPYSTFFTFISPIDFFFWSLVKANPVLDCVTRHEDVSEKGGTFPRILNLDTRWK